MSLLPSPLPPRPRLLAEAADWPRLRQQVVVDPPSHLIFATLRRRAESILAAPVLTRAMTGRMLLMVSREALERISVLALVARVDEDARFAARAVREMRAVAVFADWNPSHFLDTAEMALALSIGHDWLFDDLDAESREMIEDALLTKALQPSLDADAKSNWWLSTDENWAQVCHGGLAAAAIAVAEREPFLSGRILQRALDGLSKVAANYAPDGAWPEGPMYWSYGTAYQVTLAAALLRVTGSTHGVDAYPGFIESAEYIRQVTAPSGDFFNYADCAARRRIQAQLFWMARRTGRPDLVQDDLATLAADLSEYEADPGVQYAYYDMLALALLWYQPAILPVLPSPTAASWQGQGAMPVSIHRRREGDLFLGVKGGSVGISHSHMDVGSFVFEVQGVRWAVDTGMQDYDSLESAKVDLWNEREQASQRWDVFRIGPESHSILRFDRAPQVLLRKGRLFDVSDQGCAVDLSMLHGDDITSAIRRFDLIDDGIRVRDTWQAAVPTVASWQWMTCANVSMTTNGLLLRQSGRTLRLRVRGSLPFQIFVDDVSAPMRHFDLPNPGLRRIRVENKSPDRKGWHQVEAAFEPSGADDATDVT